MPLPTALRSYLAEPAAEDPPQRVWRDYALIAITSVTALLELFLRTDEEWTAISTHWQWAGVAMFFVAIPPALWFRRSHPLPAAMWGFGLTLVFGAVVALFDDEFGGVWSTAVVLVCLYSLMRWGSGRHGAYGVLIALIGAVVGNLTDPTTGPSEWIGGLIVLAIPILLGLAIRFQQNARRRAMAQAQSLEREELARELHDTVAHHVSAIAVQAQAGRALAVSDPQRAAAVLEVIEEEASRTLIEMRSIVGTLRNGVEAQMTPAPDLHDLRRLGDGVPDRLRVEVEHVGTETIGEAVQAALFRIARESVTNVVRHAPDATVVRVMITSDAEHVRLTVTDNGRSARETVDPGFGLLGMAERAELLGGTFHAGPTAERSWAVVAELPRPLAGQP